MKLVLITGPQAVGKMTVGQHLAARTGLKLFHNHMTIDLVSPFFDYSTQEGRALVAHFRQKIFEAVAASDLPGLIFTYVWAFDLPSERPYVDSIIDVFTAKGATVYLVELEANLEERLTRNASENRLAHKPSKRDLDWSEAELRKAHSEHRMNSEPGELDFENYVRIDTTTLTAGDTARSIIAHFGW